MLELLLYCALRCCLLLLQLCLLFKHLRSAAISPFFSRFCHFRIFFTLRCQLFSSFAVTFFSLINSCAFSYYLSFLLPDEARGRNVVKSSVCCPSFFCSSFSCSLNYYTSILFVLHKCRNFFSVAHFRVAIVVFSARFRAAFCCFNFAFC